MQIGSDDVFLARMNVGKQPKQLKIKNIVFELSVSDNVKIFTFLCFEFSSKTTVSRHNIFDHSIRFSLLERHYISWDTEALLSWLLEGSNNGTNWETLSAHRNDETLTKAGQVFPNHKISIFL